MKDILLINPPLDPKQRYGEFSDVGTELPNLGLAYLASFLRENGTGVEIIDAPAMGFSPSQIASEAKSHKPVIVGFTAATVAINSAAACAKEVRKVFPDALIVIGGPHVSSLPEETLAAFPIFDLGVLGEGERTLLELVSGIKEGKDYWDIPGVAFLKEDGKGIITEPRPLITDLDSLPMPAWDLLPDLAKTYRPSPQSTFRLPSTILFTTRGCPFNCTFCDRSVFGRKVRSHSAKRVFEMMEHLYKKYRIVHFAFHDESFIFDKERLLEFCRLLIRSGLPLTWVCQGRVDQPVSKNTLLLMKKAGCRQLQFGIETADNNLLGILKKGITIEQVRRALLITKSAGISTKAFFMIGLFGETEESMKKTAQFILEAPLDDIMISFFTPFPGSAAYEQVEKYGKLTGSFENMSEYEVVFTPNGLTSLRIAAARKEIYRRFYFRPRIFFGYLARLRYLSAWKILIKSFFSTLRALR